jgi:hypothetical protein
MAVNGICHSWEGGHLCLKKKTLFVNCFGDYLINNSNRTMKFSNKENKYSQMYCDVCMGNNGDWILYDMKNVGEAKWTDHFM